MRNFASFRLIVAAALAYTFALIAFPTPTAAQRASRERTIYVSAVDSAGEPVTGLHADAFIVREDGVRREVLRVTRATEPIDIAVLVDNSAAVNDEIIFFREGLKNFVAKMAPCNNVALIALAD